MHLNINDIGNTRIVIRITALLDAQPSHSRSVRLGQLYPELYGPSRRIKKKAAARFLRKALYYRDAKAYTLILEINIVIAETFINKMILSI